MRFIWSWLTCFGLLRRVAPSNVDVWRHQSSDRKRVGRNVGVEVTVEQRLQLGIFFARAFLNPNDTVMHVQRQANRAMGRILMESLWEVTWSAISIKKQHCALRMWPHLTDAIESVSLFKNHIWNDIWGLNSVKSRTVGVWVVKLFSTKTSE